MNHKIILETRRLYLRKFENPDIPEMANIYSDEDVMRYIGRGGPIGIAHTLKMLEHWKNCYESPGYGIWALINKDDNKLIGHCGFSYLKQLGETEISYLIDKPFWGKGLVSEISQATLNYGFTQIGFKKIVALVYPDNKPSIRIIEKMGMEFIREGEFFGKTLFLYSITKKHWEKQLTMKIEE